MPSELLELTTIAVLHSFHSQDWYNYLKSKLPLPVAGFDVIQNLGPGGALVFAARTLIREGEGEEEEGQKGAKSFVLQVRPRITEDRGETVRSSSGWKKGESA